MSIGSEKWVYALIDLANTASTFRVAHEETRLFGLGFVAWAPSRDTNLVGLPGGVQTFERTDRRTTTGTGQPADCPSETATTAARSAPQSRVAVSRIRAEADLPVCQPGKPLAERANFAKVLKG